MTSSKLFKFIILLLFGCFFVCASTGHTAEDKKLYRMATKAAKNGQWDFAYMRFRNILLNFPQSPYRQEAQFVHGEYHFLIPDYPVSQQYFEEYVRDFPDSDGKMFALAYLLKMAQLSGKSEEAEALSNEIINLKQVSLIFRDFKDYEFVSPLNRRHKAVFQIDTIDFYVDGNPLVSISY